MSIRDELAIVLLEHRTIGATWGDISCCCGWTGSAHSEHLAAAILARFGVVELPEPDESGTWMHGAIHAIDGEVEHYIRGMASVVRSPKAARALAAALLAAANRAEAQP